MQCTRSIIWVPVSKPSKGFVFYQSRWSAVKIPIEINVFLNLSSLFFKVATLLLLYFARLYGPRAYAKI